MKTISIRELHTRTGHYVRRAANPFQRPSLPRRCPALRLARHRRDPDRLNRRFR